MTLLEKIDDCKNNNKHVGNLISLINKNYDGWKDQLIDLTSFLDNYYVEITSSQRFFHIWFNDYDIHYCPICHKVSKFGKKFYRMDKHAFNYLSTCGDKMCINRHAHNMYVVSIQNKYGVLHPMQNKSIQKKQIQTCLDRYGVTNVMKNESIQDKCKQLCQEKYGVNYTFQTQNNKDKSIQTCLDRYDVLHPMQNKSIQKKQIQTCLDRYGVTNVMYKKDIRDKIYKTCFYRYGYKYGFHINISDNNNKRQQTWLRKYGVDHPMKNIIIFQKMQVLSYHTKPYILPSGKKVKIQGYENKFLDEYFKNGGPENDILIENNDIEKQIGKIMYITYDGKEHRYYPDFYIISENKIIEVKSEYTSTCDIDINKDKARSCLQKGLNFEFKIY